MRKGKGVELLTPAGNPAAFYAAVSAGADAVYLGGSRFGARAYAENFTTEELTACIRYGKLLGCSIYLTVNTLMKESELDELYGYLLPFYEAGLDGVIVQDLGAFRRIRECFPGLALHASTQMTLCSTYGIQRLKNMGADRVVPARELSLAELAEIRRTVDIELETFIHGAMCYCYSGQCLFSSILGGRSGNRGRCAQPCRLSYSLKQNGYIISREQYLLSLKDMCTIEHLPELIEAGIDSFKIEGRMKRPEYAAGVTAAYRRYIDRYYELREQYGSAEAAERFRVGKADYRTLTSLYIRGEIQDGYYFRHNGKEMVTLDSPAYRQTEEKLLQEIRDSYLTEKKKLPVTIQGCFREGQAALVSVSSSDCTVNVMGEIVEPAKKQPITEENIRKQLGRLGDTAFSAAEIRVVMDRNVFFPLKQLNELRRMAVERLEETLLLTSERSTCTVSPSERATKTFPAKKIQGGFAVSVMTAEQLNTLASWILQNRGAKPDAIYVSGDLFMVPSGNNDFLWQEKNLALCEELARECHLFLALPPILRNTDASYLDSLYRLCGEHHFDGYLIRSMDGLGYLEGREKNGEWRLDTSFYLWNKDAFVESGTLIDSCCLPYELKGSEQRKLAESGIPLEKCVYGRIPMMVTANCVLKTADRCKHGSQEKVALCDRYSKEFPVLRCCLHCLNIIYNSVPLVLTDTAQWKSRARLRLDFTVETAAEMYPVLEAFLLGEKITFDSYTTGHEKRGVE